MQHALSVLPDQTCRAQLPQGQALPSVRVGSFRTGTRSHTGRAVPLGTRRAARGIGDTSTAIVVGAGRALEARNASAKSAVPRCAWRALNGVASRSVPALS